MLAFSYSFSIRFLGTSKKLLKLILIPAQRLPWHSHLELLVEAHWVLVAMLKMQEKMQQARWCKQFYHVTSTSHYLNQCRQPPCADKIYENQLP